MAVVDDALQRRLRLVQVGLFPLQPAQPRIGMGHHARQRLVDLVGDRGRQDLHGRQARFPYPAFRRDGPGELGVQRRRFRQQDEQDEAPRHQPVDAAGPPADAEAAGADISQQERFDQPDAQDHHQPEVQHRTPPRPQQRQRHQAQDRGACRNVAPHLRDLRAVGHQARQQGVAGNADPGQPADPGGDRRDASRNNPAHGAAQIPLGRTRDSSAPHTAGRKTAAPRAGPPRSGRYPVSRRRAGRQVRTRRER